MSDKILNIKDVEFQPRPAEFAPTGAAAEKYDARIAQIGQRLGAQKLGYNITLIPIPLHTSFFSFKNKGLARFL